MPRFFSDTPLADLARDQEIRLADAVFHHAVRVRRLKAGDTCTLFDGHGEAWTITLVHIDKKAAHARVDHHYAAQPLPRLRVHLALAVTATERMDWALQKGTELGISGFTPFYSEYSNARLDAARQARRHEHWQAILASACEQCGQNRLPVLHALQTFDTIVATATDPPPAWRLFLDARAPRSLSALLDGHVPPTDASPRTVLLMIGPEGGFSAHEIDSAQHAHWQPARLGPRILRAETAAAVATALVQARLGDLG